MDDFADVVKDKISDIPARVKAKKNFHIEEAIDQQYEKICSLLQSAIELELTTLPPYLTAYFSIMEHSNVEAANRIRSVFMEEMLHLCLAGNVLVSIGGRVRLGEKNIPTYPCKLKFDGKFLENRDFSVSLEKFSKTSMFTFRRIELPDKFPPIGLPEFAAEDEQEQSVTYSVASIGELYTNIRERLELLDRSYRGLGKALFRSDTSNQITETYFWRGGGKPVAVTDLASAKEALSIIIEQGEGASGSLDDGDEARFGQEADRSHYFKFSEIYYEQRYLDDDNPRLPPTGTPFPVDFTAVYPVKRNAKHSDYANNTDLAGLNRKFNQAYSLMLQQIEEAFAGNPKVLYLAIMNGMHDLTPLARTMAKIKIDPRQSTETGAPSFEWIQPLAESTATSSE